MKKAVQQIMLGTVTGTYEKALATLKAVRQAGYEGIELNGFMIRPSSFLIRMLTKLAGMPTGNGGKLDWQQLVTESGLAVVSVHEDLGSIERDPHAVIEEARRFGTDKIVITGMYRFDYTQKENMVDLARRLNAAGKTLAEAGIHLLYHNHNIELQKAGEKRAYDWLLELTDPDYVSFEFDSYWFTEAGADAKMYMQKLGSRMKLWHITDRGNRGEKKAMTPILTSDCVELGLGNMDLDGMMALAQAAGVETVILESHKNFIDGDPIKSLEVSARYFDHD